MATYVDDITRTKSFIARDCACSIISNVVCRLKRAPSDVEQVKRYHRENLLNEAYT